MILPGFRPVLIITPERSISRLRCRSAGRICRQIQVRSVIFRKLSHISFLRRGIPVNPLKSQTGDQPQNRAGPEQPYFLFPDPVDPGRQKPQQKNRKKNHRTQHRLRPALLKRQTEHQIYGSGNQKQLFLPVRKSDQIFPGMNKNICHQHRIGPRKPVGSIGKSVHRIAGERQQKKYRQQKISDFQRCVLFFCRNRRKIPSRP